MPRENRVSKVNMLSNKIINWFFIYGIIMAIVCGGVAGLYTMEAQKDGLYEAYNFFRINLSNFYDCVDINHNLTLYGKEYIINYGGGFINILEDDLEHSNNSVVLDPDSAWDNDYDTSAIVDCYGSIVWNFTDTYPLDYNITLSLKGAANNNIEYNNITIPQACRNQSEKIKFTVEDYPGGSANLGIFCHNGTASDLIDWIQYSGFGSCGEIKLYDYSLIVGINQSPIIISMNGNTESNIPDINLTNNDISFHDGIISKYGYFDGDDYGNYSGFPETGDTITLSAYVKDSSVSTYPVIIHLPNTISLYKYETVPYYVCQFKNTTGSAQTVYSLEYDDNELHMVTCVHNGTHGSIYIDGSYKNKGYVGDLNSSTNSLEIGRVGSNYWKGIIDDVRIYSSALSADEILDLYRNSRPPMLQDDGGLNFSGNGSHMNTSAAIDLSGTDVISAEAYFTFYSTGNWQQILEHSESWLSHNDAWDMFISPTDALYVSVSGDVGFIERTKQLTSGQTYHIIASIDKGASPDDMHLYINGVEDYDTATNNDNTNNFGNHNVYVGKRPGTSYYLNGTIELLKIYNRSLTESEVIFLNATANDRIQHGQCGVDFGCHYPVFNLSFYDEINYSDIYVNSYASLTSDTDSSNASITNATTIEYCQNLPSIFYNDTWDFYGSVNTNAQGYLTRVFTIDAGQRYNASVLTPFLYPLYLIPTENSSTIIFTWLTTQYQPVNGLMEIYRCAANGSLSLVESVNILSGQAVANLELLYQSYSYAVIVDGVRYEDDSFAVCHTEGSQTRTYFVNIQPINYTPAIGLFLIDCQLEKVGDNMVNMRWASNSELSGQVEGCMVAYRSDIYNKTEIYRNCSNSSEYSMTRTIPADGNTYYVTGELHHAGRTGYCRNTISFYTPAHQGGAFGVSALLAVLIMVMSINLIYHWDNDLQVVLSLLGIAIGVFLGIVLLDWTWVIGMASFIAIIIIIGRGSQR